MQQRFETSPGDRNRTDEHALPVYQDGHDLHPIIRHAALATPSDWVDAIVVSSSEDGTIELSPMDNARTVRCWHHADLSNMVPTGTPVALHNIYPVLAVGDEILSIRAL
ncbi:hypothetical protein [Herbiconiux daphne]|uniref:Uncharacterized protein n=1 Tax=Herbiconiux daphne TaxID=2970914 RepID=A0ABT2H766_9MICO|nr:hypothetical protein [Herbiconiux daphne]MCS5735805.1 hypothetical protein [Herbiconiux daphne]